MNASEVPATVDAVVIGAGVSGLYMIYSLRELGLSTLALEAGTDVGGTWFWNRYPGARCDSESWCYAYTFDKSLEQEWDWSCRYPEQPEILAYLNHVADRFDLRSSIRFQTRVESAVLDEATGTWTVRTDGGDEVRARYLVTAVGCLSAAQVPAVDGLDRFTGDCYHTGSWPHEGVDLTGKRVAVVGTGSSGMQTIPVIAEQAAQLTVLQRTPNFAIPARNYVLGERRASEIKGSIGQIRDFTRHSFAGFPFDLREGNLLDIDPDVAREQFEEAWEAGGFELVFAGYGDVLVDEKANAVVADFVREKIAEVVDDPETVARLQPRDYPIGTKRVVLDTNYFETYNRDNVELVSLREEPLHEVTATGIRVGAREIEVDAIVFATGFDGLTGALGKIDIKGRGGERLKEKWAAGPRTYLGVASAGFPNMFMITGPGSPSVMSNMPVSIEQHVEWIRDCIGHLEEVGAAGIEATRTAEDGWVEHVNETAAATLFPKANSWYMGANVPGKPRVFMPYLGGVGPYRQHCAEVAERGYEGFSVV
ncbi:NAD(P)/FAD-dependent oxidoreductase [Actinomycetospora sp. OC33-EN08]|uniref:NAD(P)/FAD-dependent oxidoreductase n=1 Tax=Actinomycetospora aurantiaca TaxID=3129233 RepID=A0ABU8MT48_9PSEU